MSVEIKDTNGNWVRAAGNGRAEYGASTVRSGTVTVTMPSSKDGIVDTDIIFSAPMPDDDYIVSLEYSEVGDCAVQPVSKTASGFRVRSSAATDGALSAERTINYTAFKLYTDKEYNEVLDDVAGLKKETSGAATMTSGLSGQVTWLKIGRLVQVRVNNVRNESGAIASGSALCTGLPAPKNATSFSIARYPDEANVVDIVSSGELRQTGMYSVSTGIGLFGDFMYFAKE